MSFVVDLPTFLEDSGALDLQDFCRAACSVGDAVTRGDYATCIAPIGGSVQKSKVSANLVRFAPSFSHGGRKVADSTKDSWTSGF